MLGTPDIGNVPGGRQDAASWTDGSGNLWLFGGQAFDTNGNFDQINDLWEYSPQTNLWTWMGGNNTIDQAGVYGTMGTPSVANIPGARSESAFWTDSSGNFWLFGGYGLDSSGNWGDFNDLWEFNPTANQWTWISGSSSLNCNIGTSGSCGQTGVYGTLGTPAPANIPGDRVGGAVWTDSIGNFWLLGGLGTDSTGNYGFLNDLWEFSPSTKQWTWMGGASTITCNNVDGFCGQPGVYGALDTPAAGNSPGGRYWAMSWTDSSGSQWLMGGLGLDAQENLGELNDLWRFIPSKKQWTWMGGSNSTIMSSGPTGVYGQLGVAAAGNFPGGRSNSVQWTDIAGNFWLFAGNGIDANGAEGALNDLWTLNPTTTWWTWMGGSSTIGSVCNQYGVCGQPGAYGPSGVPARGNIPGARSDVASWIDAGGNFWLFGGSGFDAGGNAGFLNDLWEYQPPVTVVKKTPTTTTLKSSTVTSVYGQSVTFTATVTPTTGTETNGETVTFMNGTTQLGTGTLASGTATLTTTALPAGTDPVAAVYSGDANFSTSTSAAVSQTVSQATTTTALASSQNPSIDGQSVTFTASITGQHGGTATGTVTFKSGTATLGSGTLSASVATYTTSSLTVGKASITAVYGGDTNFTGSTSKAVSQVVNKAATTTALTSSLNPSVYAQQVVLTATVTGQYGGSATGTVTFKNGTATLGTGTLSANVATCTTSSLAVGTASITAVYAGDANSAGSTSKPLSQAVSKATTTTAVASSPNPSATGQSVIFTATVTGQYGGTPSGTITFSNGTSRLSTVTLSGGKATYATSALTKGTASITAVYAGDTNFTGSTSTAVSQVVMAATVTALTASPAPAAFGQSVTLTATVTSTSNGVPTGKVTFNSGTTMLGIVNLTGNTAKIAISPSAVGTVSITAVYSGDTTFASSTSKAVSLAVDKATTTTALASSQNPSTSGQSVTFTATVTGQYGGTPTGTVTFKNGTTTLGTGTLSASQATYTTSSMAAGTASITAVYSGDANYSTSTSKAASLMVNKATTTTALASSPNPSTSGQSVTFTATVTGQYGGTPAGTVTFKNGSSTLGTGTLSGGGATYSTSKLAVGTASITAVYGGDTNFTTSTSKAVRQVVNSPGN
jgi:N-acetylneuraminic acid mutarotase